jgi:hypothetical protein
MTSYVPSRVPDASATAPIIDVDGGARMGYFSELVKSYAETALLNRNGTTAIRFVPM